MEEKCREKGAGACGRGESGYIHNQATCRVPFPGPQNWRPPRNTPSPPSLFFFLLETSSSSALLHHLSNLNRPLKPAHNGYMLIKHFLLTQLLARKRKKRKRAMGLAVWLKTLRQTP